MAKKKAVRKDGLYEYKCKVSQKLDGTAIRKSFYSSKSKADAKHKAETYKAQLAASDMIGEPVMLEQVDFTAWAIKWLNTYKKPFVSVATYESTYKNTIENHLIPYFGKAMLSSIKPADVQAFFASKKACSQSLLHKMKLCLTGIFQSAIDNDLIYKSPMRYIQVKSDAVQNEKKALTDTQIAVVLKAASDDGFPEVTCLLQTGLRRGELLGLMWSDIDLENAVLSVQRSISLEQGKAVIHPPKWGSYRELPLQPRTVELFRSLPHTCLYVFPMPRRKDQPQDPNHFSQRLARFFSKLPEDCRCSAHEMRHSYASQLQRKGVNIYTISKLLGHRDIKITAGTYVHPDVESLRADVSVALASHKNSKSKTK